MNDYSDLIDAIDRLTVAITETSNSLSWELLSTALATVGSVAAVLVFEFIRIRVLAPRDEFRKLLGRVNSTLIMHARYYSNPIDSNRLLVNEKTVEDYICAAAEVRRVAADVHTFSDEIRGKMICGIPSKDIKEAGRELIGLSNSFFETGSHSEQSRAENRVNEIRRLLKLSAKD